jgi:protein O-GlcNAc transferase
MLNGATAQAAGSTALDEGCRKAMELQIAGHSDLAEQLYRAILRAEPAHAAANHCFGMLHVQSQRPAEGLPYLLTALNVSPEVSDYWLGYLEALLAAAHVDTAKNTLALARQHGLSGVAVENFAKRLAAKSTRAHRRREAALVRYEEADLLSLMRQRRFADALAQARMMTGRFPERGLGWKVLGALLGANERHEDALAAMQVSVRLLPRDAQAHSNLGTTLGQLKRYEEAIACHQRALEIDPTSAAAHYRLGMTYEQQGRYAEAEAHLRSGISLRIGEAEGDDEQNYSNLLYILSHQSTLSPDALFAEHCRYGEYFETPLRASWPTHRNRPDADRRLQVGFVSGDLNDHAVGGFMEPVLAHLCTRPDLELHAYYNNVREDAVSARLRGFVQHWNPVAALSDRDLAQRVQDDGIDILIDLSGHTALNRLPTFARKPAPIQVSWLGYPGTTGLCAMDYYLADRHWLPPGEFDGQFTEKLVYLPDRWAFQPHATAPEVNALPALNTGHLTFGSFNRLGKINLSTVRLWSQLLRAVPGAKMLIGGMPPDGEPSALIAQFAAEGITRERLIIHRRGTMDSYLALHHKVDICLDTQPYAGGTTTMHASWMGVPTLTVAGTTSFARAGAGVLGQLRLEGFIAKDPEDFIAKGLYWGTHMIELADERRRLRPRWQHSPERQPGFFVAQFERALRHKWRRWCAQLPPESFNSFELAPP